jgi:hypothetical protein
VDSPGVGDHRGINPCDVVGHLGEVVPRLCGEGVKLVAEGVLHSVLTPDSENSMVLREYATAGSVDHERQALLDEAREMVC